MDKLNLYIILLWECIKIVVVATLAIPVYYYTHIKNTIRETIISVPQPLRAKLGWWDANGMRCSPSYIASFEAIRLAHETNIEFLAQFVTKPVHDAIIKGKFVKGIDKNWLDTLDELSFEYQFPRMLGNLAFAILNSPYEHERAKAKLDLDYIQNYYKSEFFNVND